MEVPKKPSFAQSIVSCQSAYGTVFGTLITPACLKQSSTDNREDINVATFLLRSHCMLYICLQDVYELWEPQASICTAFLFI